MGSHRKPAPRSGGVGKRSSLALVGALLSGTVAIGTASAASAASGSTVALARSANGTAIVLVGGSRLVGFPFGPEHARVVQRDLNYDGVADLVVTNISAASPASSPSELAVYSVLTPKEGLPAMVDVGDGGRSVSRSIRGDRDNFGYGIGTGPPPCVFYDNRGPEDLGVFDYELNPGDEVNVWTHTFAVSGTPTSVTFVTYEIFSDNTSSTIDLDGITLTFASPPFAVCDAYPEGGIKRAFVLTGSDALIASDGAVTATFRENGDDVSLEGGGLLVRFP